MIRTGFTILFMALALAWSGCGASAPRQYNPKLTHLLIFKMPRSCTDKGVTIVVDDKAYPFPEHSRVLQLTVSEGVHKARQLIGNYEVRRWPSIEVDRDSFITLECFHSLRKPSVRGDDVKQ